MGGALTKEYDVSNQTATAGPGGIWQIYPAVKKTSKEPVSILICQKKLLQKYDKACQESIYARLRHDAQYISRLHHPKVLKVIKPLEENSQALVLVVEPIWASLNNILGNTKGIPPADISESLRTIRLSQPELKMGITDIAEALKFCHDDARLVHGNVTPESIFVTEKGEWKLGAFCFAEYLDYKGHNSTGYKYAEFEGTSQVDLATKPTLAYMAPEYVEGEKYDTTIDTFSLGCVFYECFTRKQLIAATGNILTYQQNLAQLQKDASATNASASSAGSTWIKAWWETEGHDSANVPDQFLQSWLTVWVAMTPSQRYRASSLLTLPFFVNDVVVKSLRYLDNFSLKDSGNKAHFLRHFPTVAAQCPTRAWEKRILPACARATSETPALVPYILPVLLIYAEKQTNGAMVREKLQPLLTPLYSVTQPLEVPYALVKKTNLLMECMSAPMIEHCILPHLWKCLGSGHPPLVKAALQSAEPLMQTLPFASLQLALPLIASIIASPRTQDELRILALQNLAGMIGTLDGQAILSVAMPAVKRAARLQPQADCILPCLSICRSAAAIVPVEDVLHLIGPIALGMLLPPKGSSEGSVSSFQPLTSAQMDQAVGMVHRLIDGALSAAMDRASREDVERGRVYEGREMREGSTAASTSVLRAPSPSTLTSAAGAVAVAAASSEGSHGGGGGGGGGIDSDSSGGRLRQTMVSPSFPPLTAPNPPSLTALRPPSSHTFATARGDHHPTHGGMAPPFTAHVHAPVAAPAPTTSNNNWSWDDDWEGKDSGSTTAGSAGSGVPGPPMGFSASASQGMALLPAVSAHSTLQTIQPASAAELDFLDPMQAMVAALNDSQSLSEGQQSQSQRQSQSGKQSGHSAWTMD
jgi:serine/threonine protein kinase